MRDSDVSVADGDTQTRIKTVPATLRAGLLPVHVEGDLHVEQGQLGRLLTVPELAVREAIDPLHEQGGKERGVPELAKSSS